MSNTQRDESVTPIFELTKAQLRPIVENVAGEPVASFDIRIEHQVKGHYGIRGEKAIPTFIYATRSGRTDSAVVFVKRQHDSYPGHAEAHHYTYLAQHNAPIPRMYGVIRDLQQREILFLEYLDAVTEEEPCHRFLNDPDQFPQFLRTIARFNAIDPSEEYADRLRQDKPARPGPPGWSWDKRLAAAEGDLNRIWEDANQGKLGPAFQEFCSDPDDGLDALQRLARKLVEPISRMWEGLCVYDCYPHGAGWRRDTGELLIFDLEYVGFEVRFYDVAPWLGAPDDVQPRCLPREELAKLYLQEYAHWGRDTVPLIRFLEETRMLWIAWVLGDLCWWRDRAVDGPLDPTKEDSEQYRRENQDELRRQLSILLGEVS